MPRIQWGSPGSRLYEAGVDRGVLYVSDQPGVAWNGLTSVSENPTGGDSKSYYIDGMKYLNTTSMEEFEASITAYTYPDEFLQCDGTSQIRGGLFLNQQRRKPFGLTYRTKIGNDLSPDGGYKIHIVYNALASPSERSNSSIGETIDPMDFTWDITTRPPVMDGYKRTSHVVVDSRYTEPGVLIALEDILYGSEANTARLPGFEELLAIFDAGSHLVITDNGDGTWTATAPFDVIRMLDDTVFEITSTTASYIDADTYTISSTP